jgi:hypothetical protein
MIKPIRATGLERLELQRLRDRVGRLYAALEEATEAENPLASGAWAPPGRSFGDYRFNNPSHRTTWSSSRSDQDRLV